MIPEAYIREWTEFVPWQNPNQIEQDLLITAVLLKIYQVPELRESLAFRGGTALNKLFFNPPSRYSEDVDLVQIKAEPIGSTINLLRTALDSWLGKPQRTFGEGRVTLLYRNISESGVPLKLKIEINSREHFADLGFVEYVFESKSSWMPGKATICSYKVEELLGTKMRALYQRRKGRDLYDLYIALNLIPKLDLNAIVKCFNKYIGFSGGTITQATFKSNLEIKIKNEDFRRDVISLLPKNSINYDPDEAYKVVLTELVSKI